MPQIGIDFFANCVAMPWKASPTQQQQQQQQATHLRRQQQVLIGKSTGSTGAAGKTGSQALRDAIKTKSN